ncbi:MAG: hypothetical protein JXC33_04900 [Deltaproteobacteria bacterium]|nr:hypothetical protein [Deltaproteobacteria bacterium]
MIDEERSALHRIVVDKYRKGELSIDVNRSTALLHYARVSPNPLVKLFHFAIRIYSFPLTVVGVIFASIFADHYIYILYYLVGLFGFITFEDYLSKVSTINSALENQNVFVNLHRRGVICIREAIHPDIP